MTVDDPDYIRAAIVQQLQSDRLLGVKSVPIPPLRPVRRTFQSVTDQRDQQAGSPGRSHNRPTAPDANAADKADRLRVLNDTQVKGCTKCPLSKTRTQTVFGQGNHAARLVFVGEAPGFEEDKQGLAFVGRAGQLLTRMIVAMGLTRDEVFICNVLKCRPPQNRDPTADEILACRSHLQEQLSIIQPEVLVALGSPAAKTLLNTAQGIGKLRGRFHEYYPSGITGIGPSVPVMPTYHPAYLLRSPGEKHKTWDDLQMVMQLLGLSAK